jgi:hypothetical protein
MRPGPVNTAFGGHCGGQNAPDSSYSELENDGPTVWEKGLENRDPHYIYYTPSGDDADGYHYRCPKEWLAYDKDHVELVVIVSRGSIETIGYYDGNANRPAFASTYELKCFDVRSEAIVAKGAIRKSDQNIEPTLHPFTGSWNLPSPDEVEQQIREHVTFRDVSHQ